MRKELEGIYAPYIKQYIDFKRSLGFKYDTEAKVFAFFDRFTIMRDEKTVGITQDMAVDWVNINPNESSSYKYHRCVCLNQLASYLCKIGFRSYIMQLPTIKNTFTPYIFSRKQVAALFEASDTVTGKKKEWTALL
jgi:integrase/recombinase XerD